MLLVFSCVWPSGLQLQYSRPPEVLPWTLWVPSTWGTKRMLAKCRKHKYNLIFPICIEAVGRGTNVMIQSLSSYVLKSKSKSKSKPWGAFSATAEAEGSSFPLLQVCGSGQPRGAVSFKPNLHSYLLLFPGEPRLEPHQLALSARREKWTIAAAEMVFPPCLPCPVQGDAVSVWG